MTSAQNKRHGPLLRLSISFIGLDYLDLIGDIRTYIDSIGTEGEVILTDKFEHFSQFCVFCVGSSESLKCD